MARTTARVAAHVPPALAPFLSPSRRLYFSSRPTVRSVSRSVPGYSTASRCRPATSVGRPRSRSLLGSPTGSYVFRGAATRGRSSRPPRNGRRSRYSWGGTAGVSGRRRRGSARHCRILHLGGVSGPTAVPIVALIGHYGLPTRVRGHSRAGGAAPDVAVCHGRRSRRQP